MMNYCKIIFTLCLHLISSFLSSSLFIGCFPFMIKIHGPFDNRYFYEAFIIFVSTPTVAVLKSQEAFHISGVFIHCWYKCLLHSQWDFFLFLVIISLLLYCKANPISLISVVLFLFLFSAFFNDILIESFSFSSNCRLFQSSLKFVYF